MTKLNFGCGCRFAPGWVNIDFHAPDHRVQRVNLLGRWPFPDFHFDVVYSSHTLEHFSPDAVDHILAECNRILREGGLIRTVVPDLENTCREYLRLLDQVDTSETARRRYEWIILELLDQMTRTEVGSPMTRYRARLLEEGDQVMIDYVKSRTDTNPWTLPPRTLRSKLRGLTPDLVKNKLVYLYVAAVKKLLPSHLRNSVIDNTRIGEKHKWMYDRHNLGALMKRHRFSGVKFLTAEQSDIPGFQQDLLDVNADGTVYKPCSLYCEARKS